MTGRTLSHYELLEEAGRGGMGVVYKARDQRLDRFVAIKVLPPDRSADPERLRRFVQEAKAASALNHPNIVVIHDIDSAEGVEFIVMEYVEGKSLRQIAASGTIAIEDAVRWAVEIAGALAAAHGAGIVHRDIKPANIMLNAAGRVKVLDFGLAKLAEPSSEGEQTATLEAVTRPGAVLGTAAYMSPEQAEGRSVDARSDVFSFGAVLYEMLAGRKPFQGESHLSTMAAVLRDTPAPVRSARPEAPMELERIVNRCLEKDREKRYPSAAELSHDLAAFQARLTQKDAGIGAIWRPQVAIPACLLLLVLAGGIGWLWLQNARAREARDVLLPEAARLASQMRSHAALQVLRRAERSIPDDPQLRQLRDSASHVVSIRTVPPGAEVAIKDYATPEAPWEVLGTTPLENIRVPVWYLRWKVSKAGFETAERAQAVLEDPKVAFTLDASGAAPPGMVRVPAGVYLFRDAFEIPLEEYRIDKYEVTNRQFKEFIDRGGYQKREYWKTPIEPDGRVVSWETAIAQFRDPTGRPGPAGWELGSYPDGQAEFPVGGVSWYEAAAYCESTGKTLPTVYHWYNAAGTGIISDILFFSNFGLKGPARVGSHPGLGAYGAYDMAGNVKEWCWNRTGAKRYILGGAWNEPSYMFTDLDAKPPLERAAVYGFRCAQYVTPVAQKLTGPIENPSRDYSKEKPVDDRSFALIRGLYAYEQSPLKSQVEAVDDTHPHWRQEKITFNAAYGNERVIAHLFLPKNATPPYETVVYFPGSAAIELRSSENLAGEMLFNDFILRSGRALLHPVYKGTYERHVDSNDANAWRETVFQSAKDMRRAIDYVATRSDLDASRLAYYGLSWGANRGPIMTALEPRFKAVILLAGGLTPSQRPPEMDALNFAPRVTAPTLMLNGRYDFKCPVATCSEPLFRVLGAPEKDKRSVVYEAGHLPGDLRQIIREMLDWLDRYLGPVKAKG